jgi:hypothetical protein
LKPFIFANLASDFLLTAFKVVCDAKGDERKMMMDASKPLDASEASVLVT